MTTPMQQFIEQLNSVIESLTDVDGGSAVSESDIREAKEELKEIISTFNTKEK